MEGPVLGHVAVVVTGAVEGQHRQHGAEPRLEREAKLGKGLPAGQQSEPAEHPLQRPDPDKSPHSIAQRIEGEDHRPLDVDHVAIEHTPFAPHLAHHREQRGIKARRHGVEERVAQTEEQRQQGGQQHDGWLDARVDARRGETDGVIHEVACSCSWS